MALERFLNLFAHRFLCVSSISSCFSYSYVRQTKLASSLVNFSAQDKSLNIKLIVETGVTVQCYLTNISRLLQYYLYSEQTEL